MSDRLIDTNILVYAYDISEGTKHDIAKEILKRHAYCYRKHIRF